MIIDLTDINILTNLDAEKYLDNIIKYKIINSHNWEIIDNNYADYICNDCSYILFWHGTMNMNNKTKTIYLYCDNNYGDVEKLLTCAEIQLENIIK